MIDPEKFMEIPLVIVMVATVILALTGIGWLWLQAFREILIVWKELPL